MDSLLVIQKFLIDLKSKIELDLASFGSKPLKTSGGSTYGFKLSQTTSKTVYSDRMLKSSTHNKINVKSHGYDFTRIGPNWLTSPHNITSIKSDNYYNLIVSNILTQLIDGDLTEDTLTSTFWPGPYGPESISQNAFFISEYTTWLY